MKRTTLTALLLAFASFPVMSFMYLEMANEESSEALVSAGATINGTVKYEGAVPKMRSIDMGAEPSCAAKHPGGAKSQALVLGEGNTMANIFVRVKSGLSKTSYETPKEPVVVDQKGCTYEPHVFGVMAGQDLKFLNSDGVLHNIHPLPKVNRPFNVAMPKTVKETVKKFAKVEDDKFVVKCDVHPWMRAYMAVMPHPFFSVTQKDGKFSISGLEPGTYEIEAWHERMKTRTATVTVKAGETVTQDFTFKRPAKK